jgi:mannosyltransferase OCH1-like enzyme
LFGDDYKMKTKCINYYNNLAILKPNTIIIKPNKSIIPLNIFQTWYTLDLPTEMNICVNSIKTLNPEFNYYLYDDEMCRQFIINHFHKDVINAYDSLIPGAYKADLWRYCILYIYGGIYLDIKFQPVNGFKFIVLTDKEHFVLDRPYYLIRKSSWNLYNGFMITKKNNPILLKSIEIIVNNVKNKYYGDNCLHPTGPSLLGEIYFNSFNKSNLQFELVFNAKYKINFTNKINISTSMNIIYKNTIILQNYTTYRKDQKKAINKYYGILWKERKIYKKNWKY